MRKMILIKFLLTTLLLSGQETTELKGFVRNIDIDTLVVAQAYKDLRYSGIEIPITKGQMFKFTLEHEYIEEYSIVYKSDLKNGAWRPINFFPNGKTIGFELYPTKNYNDNKIIGDNLGDQKIIYQKSFEKKFSQLGNDIYGRLFQLEKNSDEYVAVKSRLDSLNKEVLGFKYNYFLNDDSILGLNEYVFLLQNANQMMITPAFFKVYQDYYLKRYFDHPLTERAFNLYTALSSIKVGQKYVDVTLMDKYNTASKLSDFKDKKEYTLIDLWAPWCGPCIKKSRLLKENFSTLPSNIQIIGVVGGVDEVAKAETAIDKFQYPWENYYEISDQNKIWEKYGIENSGGAQFLIDSKGIILAINPEIEELLKIVNRN